LVEVVAYGLGPIGQRIAARLSQRAGVRVIAGIDLSPDLIGGDLGELLGGEPDGIRVASDLNIEAPAGGVVVQATSSRLRSVTIDAIRLASSGWNVLSTCEEMVCPTIADPELVAALDAAARTNGVTIVGSGINPGFVMDTLVTVLSLASARVDAVDVLRMVDTNSRRGPLQEKSGVGMQPQRFRQLARDGLIGHVGLKQSAYLVMDQLGWTNISYTETLEPIVGEVATNTPRGQIPAGSVIGQRQTCLAQASEGKTLSYRLEMGAGLDPTDEIVLSGEPPLRMRIDGGVNGDLGTEAVVANLVPLVSRAPAGLLSMADLVPVACQA
jgi:2,4-diaminopentanoate dehydrogenase